tara:strand:+ start:656 stop:880 length:225 start_codon:yes stop_codon:yes gene_type:complete
MTPTQKVALYIAIIIGSATLLVAGAALIFFADTEIVRGSDHWCDIQTELPHKAWQEPDFALYAKECLDPAPIIY